MDEIEQKVKKIVAEQLGIKEADVRNEASFIDDLGADSLSTVELSLALEDAFGIEEIFSFFTRSVFAEKE